MAVAQMLISLVAQTPSVELTTIPEVHFAWAIAFTKIIRHIPAITPAQPTQAAANQQRLNYRILVTQIKRVL